MKHFALYLLAALATTSTGLLAMHQKSAAEQLADLEREEQDVLQAPKVRRQPADLASSPLAPASASAPVVGRVKPANDNDGDSSDSSSVSSGSASLSESSSSEDDKSVSDASIDEEKSRRQAAVLERFQTLTTPEYRNVRKAEKSSEKQRQKNVAARLKTRKKELKEELKTSKSLSDNKANKKAAATRAKALEKAKAKEEKKLENDHKQVVKMITRALSQIKKEHADKLSENADWYDAQINVVKGRKEKLDTKVAGQKAKADEKKEKKAAKKEAKKSEKSGEKKSGWNILG